MFGASLSLRPAGTVCTLCIAKNRLIISVRSHGFAVPSLQSDQQFGENEGSLPDLPPTVLTNPAMTRSIRNLMLLWLLPGLAFAEISKGQDQAGLDFFEQKIRPVLAQHCYSCHSQEAATAGKLKAQLYLDTAAGIASGGESGPVLVPGKSAESSLLKVIRYDGLEMPPSGKLPEEVAADFARWIDLGAPDPRTGEAPQKKRREINVAEGREWWAFRPIQQPVPPNPQTPIDSLILAAQQKHGVASVGPATKEKLIRRAWFDLTGLPPQPQDIAAFLQDTSAEAFPRLVDKLLESPAYGERWARHWLDAARFAESGGYEFDGFRPGAYHYRDWVIKSLNADLPFDQFVRMQLAGDLIRPDTTEGAAATGFLVAGPYPGQITAKTVERIRYDQLDDMMMTIGGSMLGLTLGCVRCHDHKYDPLPQTDYYAIAATLATTAHGSRTLDYDSEATEKALATHAEQHQPFAVALKTHADMVLPERFAAWKKDQLPAQPDASRWQILEPAAAEAGRSWLKLESGGLIVHDGQIMPGVSFRYRGQQRNISSEERYELQFSTFQKNLQSLRLDALSHKALPQRGPGLNDDGSFQLAEIILTAKPLDPGSAEAAQTTTLKPVFAAFSDENQPVAQATDGKPETAWVVRTTAKKDNAAVFEMDPPLKGFDGGTQLQLELRFRDAGIGRLRIAVSTEPNPATWAGDQMPQHVAELRAVAAAYATELPEHVRLSLTRWLSPFDSDTAKLFTAERVHAAAMPRPDFREVYTTTPGGQDVFVLRRGEVDNKAGKADPGFLQVLWRGDAPAKPETTPAAEHPRMALARWMTDLDHGGGALLARVMANRLWQHHFGQGIVRTPNDFGAQGEAPTHPELLEYLAAELIRNGWKLKPLHRAIMLSAVYQQSHEIRDDSLAADPENRLFWHYQPRRMEAETIRDAILQLGGSLDRTMYGPSVLDDTPRRSIYLRVKRSELLPIMTMFDAPEPTQSIGSRSITTVPTQALTLMNSTVVRQQAEKLAAEIRAQVAGAPEDQVKTAFQRTLGRWPSETELTRMTEFVQRQKAALPADTQNPDQVAFTEFCHVLLCLNEFVYVD